MIYLLGSNERKEHVESNLDRVDKDQTVLGGDELEVDGVHNGPDLPRSLAGSKQIVLDLIANHGKRISIADSQVSEEDRHKERAPDKLIECNLCKDVLGLGSLNLFVQPVVEIVSRRSMVQETESRQSNETLPVEGSSSDEDLNSR